jgi:outer membrane protein assembly factor BamE (lipoprotein component of BamABCDE complex)
MFSCATTEDKRIEGQNFNDKLVEKIVEGKTTKQEILKMFGIPFEQSRDKNNIEKYVYVHQLWDEQQSKTYTKKLVILFENEVVKNYNFIEKEEAKGERKTEQSNEKVVPLKIIGF